MRTNCRLMMMVLAGAAWAACGDNQTQPDAPPAALCADGIDNDGDGLVDHPEDPGCESPTDDDELSAGPACSDGVDNDGDSLTDYPSDPGCLAPQQDSEDDDCPDGENCPQCANELDDDGNGMTDYPNDPGCMAASDPTEFGNNPAACGAGLVIKQLPPSGEDMGTLDATSTSTIVTPCGGGPGTPAYAYLLNLTQPRVITATTEGSAANTILDLRGANCSAAGAEITCNDDVGGTNLSSSISRSLPAGNYYLIVMGADAATNGGYKLKVTSYAGEGSSCALTSECGPGLVCRQPMGGTGLVCAQPVCNDNVDEDGDGFNGFPTDPGCASATDNDEADDCPTGPNCPACSNDTDDDGDGQIDYPADTSCSAAAGASEACTGEDDPILAITAASTQGTLVGANDDFNPSCGSDGGPDRLYTLTLPATRSLQIDTEGTVVDTILSLLPSTCQLPSLQCDDDSGTSTGASRLTFTNRPAGTYILAVDAYSGSVTPGAYTVRVSGTIATGGRCDPEFTFGGALACPLTNPCEGAAGSRICRPNICSDGIDNDGDGKTDYPMDPGCTSVDDDSETDTCPGVGPGCPECSDGADNDGDGAIDSADSSCTTPSSVEGCLTTDGIEELTQPSTTGTTVGANNDVTVGCGTTSNASPDKTYSLEVPAMRSLLIKSTNTFTSVVKLMNSTCGGAPLQCDSSSDDIELQGVTAGTYYFIMDGGSSNTSGSYTLAVSGTIQNGASCESELAQSGAITCGTGFSCKGTVGARRCLPAACFDGLDNDGDLIADFPNDPGCTSVNDDDEADTCPGGATCPVCSDGIDNDGDTFVDYPDDPSCLVASSVSEACTTTEVVQALTLPMTPTTTVGAANDVKPTCANSSNGPDRVYSLTVPPLTSLEIRNTNNFDATVSLFDATCGGAPITCSDPEDLSFGALAAGTYYYVVDSWTTASGDMTIGISGTIANGESCDGPLAASGALTCGVGYACLGAVGSRSCQPAACNDTVDNDGDGDVDYPNEPGCIDISDNDETDPATPPVCANGTDDDGDGQTDYPADTSCAAASAISETCTTSEPIETLTSISTTGTTVGTTDDVDPTCSSATTETAGDRVYALTLPALTSLSITNSNSFNAVVSLFDATCGGTAVRCSDTPEDLSLTTVAAGTYYYVVDGFGTTTDSGSYTITVQGRIANGESCESPLALVGALTCGDGYTCSGTMGSRTCQPSACNDTVDNDGDGDTDFPADPGCDSRDDNDETDPAVAPVCSNGIDDDGDGQTDYPGDMQCRAASWGSESCVSTENVLAIVGPTVTGTTVGATDDVDPSCTTGSPETAGDRVYSLTLPALTSLTILNDNPFDEVVSLFNASCGGPTVACSDSPNITTGMLTAGTYYYVVDGYSTGTGAFELTISGTIANGGSCESPLATSGALTCASGYACQGPAGGRTCQLAACNNMMDDDGDGDSDFPSDPGCDSPNDNDETDPAVAPVCSNGVDDDGDGQTDYPADAQCAGASSTSEVCRTTEPMLELVGPTTTGTTAGTFDDVDPSCTSATNETAGDRVYRLTIPAVTELEITNDTSFDGVVTLFDSTCGGTALDCSDVPEDVSAGPLAAGTYYYVVDGYSTGTGSYEIMVSGTIANGASCESPLATSGALTCATGYSCQGTAGSRTCQPTP